MLYLAMTATEIADNPALPPALAWMACHFSPYGTGLSNLPSHLPEGSMLILNDRTPIMGHDDALIARQLASAATELSCSRILLDLQRPGEYGRLIASILNCAPCPVGVSEAYAQGLSCPVFLPPLSLLKAPQEQLAPWQGREVWLEIAMDALQITVTDQGSQLACAAPPEDALPFRDDSLFCHYGFVANADSAVFTLHRTPEDLKQLMEVSGCNCFIGLYQELRQNFCSPLL